MAPKSNSLYTAWKAAVDAVKERGQLPVPSTFQNAVTAFDRKRDVGKRVPLRPRQPRRLLGTGPPSESLRGTSFWQPVERGFERELKKRLEWFEARREKPEEG
jgi:putative ATPase